MKQNFDGFVQSWKDYSEAIGMDHWPPEYDAIRVSLLLAVIGEPVKNYYLTLNERCSPETALQAIRSKVGMGKVPAKRNTITDISAFLKAKQGPRESIDHYVNRLERLMHVPEPRTLESQLLTYKIVTTNKWHHLRMNMEKIANLTLEQSLDLCRAEERVDVDLHSIRIKHVFLDTDFKYTDLYNWISGYVSSEHEIPSEFIETLAKALMMYKTKPVEEAWMDECVNLLFEKAVSAPNCSEGYAKLAKELGSIAIDKLSSTEKRQMVSFKSRLLARCQREFEQLCRDQLGLSDDYPPRGKSEESKVELDEEGQKMQRSAVGTVRFIGELYNQGQLTSSIMHSVIKPFIGKDDNEYDKETFECLYKLLTTIGPKMKENGQDMTKYFQRMDEIIRHMQQT